MASFVSYLGRFDEGSVQESREVNKSSEELETAGDVCNTGAWHDSHSANNASAVHQLFTHPINSISICKLKKKTKNTSGCKNQENAETTKHTATRAAQSSRCFLNDGIKKKKKSCI